MSELYRGGKLALAPMVRMGELPSRLLALRYGADLVWGPEIVDKKLLQCARVENNAIGTIDFVCPPRNAVIFRTAPKVEKSRLIFQMGTANPSLAVKAAKMVANDVAAIDVNSGCPKHFSMHAGMGAALLKTPDLLVSILTALVKEVGTPFGIPISVKIRLLSTKQETLDLVSRLVNTGIHALTIHCRETHHRNRQDPIRDYLSEISKVCRDAKVACLVNGGVLSRSDGEKLIKQHTLDGAMIATAAQFDLSCFQSSSKPAIQWKDMIEEFLDIAKEYDNNVANTRFCLNSLIPGKAIHRPLIMKEKTAEGLAAALQLAKREGSPDLEESEAYSTTTTATTTMKKTESSNDKATESNVLASTKMTIHCQAHARLQAATAPY